MVDSICLDEKRVLPCTAYLEGEYGISGLYMGVPVKLGAAGVEEIVKLRLSADEKKMLRASAAAVREVVGVLKRRSVMDLGLTGRTAIVCGASSGMGLGIAESLREEGANVVMFARRRELLEREARTDRRAPPSPATSRSRSDLELLVETAVETYGGVDILVNNSGGPPRATARALDAEQGGRGRRDSFSSPSFA